MGLACRLAVILLASAFLGLAVVGPTPVRADVFAFMQSDGGKAVGSQKQINWVMTVQGQCKVNVIPVPNKPLWPVELGPVIDSDVHTFGASTTSDPVQSGETFSLSGFEGSFSLLLPTPFEGKSNVLSATFTDGTLSGIAGGTTLDLRTDSVFYNSDFLSFSPTAAESLDFQFQLESPLSGPNDLATWTADSTSGTFSSTPDPQPTPEPSTWLLAVLGLYGFQRMVRTTRKPVSMLSSSGGLPVR
jgi:hypothetical protein